MDTVDGGAYRDYPLAVTSLVGNILTLTLGTTTIVLDPTKQSLRVVKNANGTYTHTVENTDTDSNFDIIFEKKTGGSLTVESMIASP